MGMEASTFTFSLRTASGANEAGGSIATWAKELQHVVLHHVPQGARLFVVGAPVADPDGFAHGDLNVVDVVAVPNRLEDCSLAKRKTMMFCTVSLPR